MDKRKFTLNRNVILFQLLPISFGQHCNLISTQCEEENDNFISKNKKGYLTGGSLVDELGWKQYSTWNKEWKSLNVYLAFPVIFAPGWYPLSSFSTSNQSRILKLKIKTEWGTSISVVPFCCDVLRLGILQFTRYTRSARWQLTVQ